MIPPIAPPGQGVGNVAPPVGSGVGKGTVETTDLLPAFWNWLQERQADSVGSQKFLADIAEANRMGHSVDNPAFYGDIIGGIIVKAFSNDLAAATTSLVKDKLGLVMAQNLNIIQKALGTSGLAPDELLSYRVELANTVYTALALGSVEKLKTYLTGLAKDARSALNGDPRSWLGLKYGVGFGIDPARQNKNSHAYDAGLLFGYESTAKAKPGASYIADALTKSTFEAAGAAELLPGPMGDFGLLLGWISPGGKPARTALDPCNSFLASTPVRTMAGLVAIGSLTVGTSVLAFNEQTGKNEYDPITAVHRNMDAAITYLTLNDGKTNQPEAITTTPEHPFYVTQPSGTQPKPIGHEDLNEHWVGAGHLQIGDKIREADGSVGTVANVVTVQQTQEMFNLTVETAHTFYVGEKGWLVHNCDIDLNKVPHIFGKNTERHGLGELVKKYGSEENALKALSEAGQEHLENYGFEYLPKAPGVIKDTVVDVGGVNITLRGAVVSGVFKIGTAFVAK